MGLVETREENRLFSFLTMSFPCLMNIERGKEELAQQTKQCYLVELVSTQSISPLLPHMIKLKICRSKYTSYILVHALHLQTASLALLVLFNLQFM